MWICSSPIPWVSTEVTASVFEIFLDRSRFRFSMFRRWVFPPLFGGYVRRTRMPRSEKRRARARWTIVAPSCDLISSPMIGIPRVRNLPAHPRAGGGDGAVETRCHPDDGPAVGYPVDEFPRAVGRREDRLHHGESHLPSVDVERGDDFDVAGPIPADIRVDQPGDVDSGGSSRVPVILASLQQRACAVPDSGHRHANPRHFVRSPGCFPSWCVSSIPLTRNRFHWEEEGSPRTSSRAGGSPAPSAVRPTRNSATSRRRKQGACQRFYVFSPAFDKDESARIRCATANRKRNTQGAN